MYTTTLPPYDLVHTGGNFMCDGFGTGFSSNLILLENSSKSEAQIDTIMKKFMGINRYIKMSTLPYDVIHHIDMHIKLLDEETLLVGEYPQGVADGPQIEANLQYVITNFNSVFGTPYKVVRIPMPPDGMGNYPNVNGDYHTYTNSVFVNKTVILPTYSQQYDTTAIRIYQEALPGYTITGIDCNSIISQLGAIHCITKEVSAADPLLISHQPLHDDPASTVNGYRCEFRIQHRSGINVSTLYYRTDTTQSYQSVAITPVSGNIFEAYIPVQPNNSTVYYYAEATSNSGKTQVRPMSAPSGYWKFNLSSTAALDESTSLPTAMQNAFPNPSHGITCIPVFTNKKTNVRISLKNIFGAEVTEIYEGIISGEKKCFVNTIGYAPGVYFIDFISEGNQFTQKLIVH
jgi:agmatine deiminase